MVPNSGRRVSRETSEIVHLPWIRPAGKMFHVKHNSPRFKVDHGRLAALLERAECAVDAHQLALLARHLELVLTANLRMNLTRITEPDAALRLHVVDSLAWTPLVAPLDGPIIDIGSGAGYPGVPLVITQHQRTVLCESVVKKADFLRCAILTLGLGAEIHAGRAEDLAQERPELAGTVVARAVSLLPALVELASPLLRLNGRLIALKGSPSSEEVARGDSAARICGMERSLLKEYVLAGGEEVRTVVEYTKLRRPAVVLPRRPGQAQRFPIGS